MIFNNRFVTFRTYDVAGDLRDTAIAITADGSFYTTLFQAFEGDVFVMFSGGDKYLYTTHYISPGNKVNFEIDNSQLKTEQTNRSLVTSGKFSNRDKLISDFDSALCKMKIPNNVLGFESYPHHFVINPESFVVNNPIGDIGSGNEPSKEVVKTVQDILAKGR
jgi:hypothetical protein